MFLTLVFYLAFALGEVVLIAFAVNVLHGLGWKTRWGEKLTLISLGIVGLASLELTRRWWFVPLAYWPNSLKVFAVVCCFVAWVVLPVATMLRWNRSEFREIGRSDRRIALAGDGPRSQFIGRGLGGWLLRIPGNEALELIVHEWIVPLKGLPAELDGLSLLHLTDLHFSPAYNRRYFEAVFDVAAAHPADLVLVTGDLIDDLACTAWIRPLFERLPAFVGRYAILGNHDFHHEPDRIAAEVTASGFTMLDGHVHEVELMGRKLAIGGTCAPWGPAIEDTAIPASDFRLLLSHTPDIAYQAARQGWNLMLCGHNHAGQVRLPVIGPVLMPSRYSRRFEDGFYRVGPLLTYVSRGVGAKHPLRIGAPPEISRFTLKAAPIPGHSLGHHHGSSAAAR